MDKSKIPTREIAIGTDDQPLSVKVYEWLTQDEEDERLKLLTGDQELDIEDSTDKQASPDANVKMKIKMSNLAAVKRHLVEHMCVELKWDAFNIMSPDQRTKLVDELQKQVDKKK